MSQIRDHFDRFHLTSRARRGVTIIELVMVLVIMGTLMTMFWKPLKETFNESTRKTATRELAVYVARARAASVQRSRPSWFVRNGNTIKIVIDSSGVKVPYGPTLNLASRECEVSEKPHESFRTLGIPAPAPPSHDLLRPLTNEPPTRNHRLARRLLHHTRCQLTRSPKRV